MKPRSVSLHRGLCFLETKTRNMKQKEISIHRQLTVFFSDTALATRGFRPVITAKDAQQLKRAIDLNIFSKTKFEQIILYFLADKSYKNLGPSIATMLSSTVLNSLQNKAINRVQFYKEIDEYVVRYLKTKKTEQTEGGAKIADLIKQLKEKLQIKTNSPRAPVKAPGEGLFTNY